jgi:hypothetical protein
MQMHYCNVCEKHFRKFKVEENDHFVFAHNGRNSV